MRRLLLLAVMLVASAAAADDVARVREQFLDYYTAADADLTAPRMQRSLADLEAHTRYLTAPERLRSDGSFSDIEYGGEPDGFWGPWDHTRRLIVMAKAWSTPGQDLYRDPHLLGQIDAALAYTQTFYGLHRLPEGELVVLDDRHSDRSRADARAHEWRGGSGGRSRSDGGDCGTHRQLAYLAWNQRTRPCRTEPRLVVIHASHGCAVAQ